MGEFPSGQRGQTVNLLLFSFDGPNPSSSTITDNETADELYVGSLIVCYHIYSF